MIRLSSTILLVCLLCAHSPAGAQIVEDGGFESGTPNPFWEESSTNFTSPICSVASCTGFFGDAFEGNWWAWFGGSAILELGSLTQEITIPSGQATLSFWLDITLANGSGQDTLTVSIDEIDLFTAFDTDIDIYHPWTQVTIDVSAFADDGNHLLSIESTTFGPQFTNFFVDAIHISVVADLPGDADGDGDVDLLDAAAFNACVTGPDGEVDPPCDTFDFDDDGDVDLVDYGAFQIAFTGS